MEYAHVILASLFSILALFLITKLLGCRQMNQLSMFDYINGITIGSIAAELAASWGKEFWQWAIARSVISTSMEKAVSCREKHRSSMEYFSFSWVAILSMYVDSPEKETSIPFTVYLPLIRARHAYGSSTRCFPFFASCSMLYPGEGEFDRFSVRANRSSMFPTAISIVSPKMRYLVMMRETRCCLLKEYEMTCVLPPLTYSTIGSSEPVTTLPISICPTQ